MSYIARIADSYNKASLTREELAYYLRHILLPGVGFAGQCKLKQARVVVIGAGGLGCPALQALAGAGVGRLTIVDADLVSLSNLSRQWLHSVERVGSNKALSARDKLLAINPFIEVDAIPEMLTQANAPSIIGNNDVILDATDNLEVRYLIDDICAELDRPWIHAALYRDSAQMTVFWASCGASFRKLYPQPAEAPSCSEAGMLGASASLVGNLQALEVIKLITGQGRPEVGRYINVDSKELKIRSFDLPEVSAPALAINHDEVEGNCRIHVDELIQSRSINEPIVLVDVRSISEFDKRSLEGSIHCSADAILESTSWHRDYADSKVVLICEEGLVSSILANAMQGEANGQVFFLEGGIREYDRYQL